MITASEAKPTMNRKNCVSFHTLSWMNFITLILDLARNECEAAQNRWAPFYPTGTVQRLSSYGGETDLNYSFERRRRVSSRHYEIPIVTIIITYLALFVCDFFKFAIALDK